MGDFKYGSHDAVVNFINEINLTPNAGKELFLQDLSQPGTIIDFTPVSHPCIKDMEMVVHSTFPLKRVINADDADVELPENSNGVLLEQMSTGFFFIVFKEDDEFNSLEVLDFSGTTTDPKKVWLSTEYLDEVKIWAPAKPKSRGTRIGGIPLNADGSPYTGPWPHVEDGWFSFIGQYQLDNGSYVHLFSNDDAQNYDYTDDMGDDDSYAIALVEGEPVPNGIIIQESGERHNSSPKRAYKTKTPKSTKRYPPRWVQGDGTPSDLDYEFLLQYGASSTYDGDTINDEFINEHYLFWNSKTGRVKLIVQSD